MDPVCSPPAVVMLWGTLEDSESSSEDEAGLDARRSRNRLERFSV